MSACDRCPDCGSDSLFDGFYDEDGYAFPLTINTPDEQVPQGVEWKTSCNDCGWLGSLPRRRQPKGAS